MSNMLVLCWINNWEHSKSVNIHLRRDEAKEHIGGSKWRIKDEYSWIHQKNILEVLTDKNKLEPEVKEYLIQEIYF